MNIKIAVVSFISCAIGCGVGFIFSEKLSKKKAGRVIKREPDGSDWAAREVRRANMEERKAQIASSWENNTAEKIQEENGYSAEEEPIDVNEVSADEYLPNRSYGWVNHKTVDGKELEIDFSLTNISGNTDKYLAGHESPSEGDTDGDDTDGDLLNIVPNINAEEYVYVIDVDEYEAEEEYERVDVTYYEEDEVFCDEDEKRIEDPDQIFGKNVDILFGRNPVNPDDVIYIKNTWFEKVYQITRIHNSYGRVVLGLDD